MQYPVIRINASQKDKVSENVVVMNPKYIDGFVWVHIPEYLKNKHFGYIGIAEVTKGDTMVKLYDTVIKDPHHPWIKINKQFLNSTVGNHLYKLSFVNRSTNDVISVYFEYIWQIDNPEKPYDYMSKYRGDVQ